MEGDVKIFVVFRSIEYDGYDSPDAAFATKETAKKYIDTKRKLIGVEWEIIELELQP